jgi:hypothetical protein
MNTSSERALCIANTMMSSGAMTVNKNNNNYNYNCYTGRKINIKKTVKRMHYSQATEVVAKQKVGVIVHYMAHYMVVVEMLRNNILPDDWLELISLLKANPFPRPVVYRTQF